MIWKEFFIHSIRNIDSSDCRHMGYLHHNRKGKKNTHAGWQNKKTRQIKFMRWNELRSMTSLQSNSSQALKPWNVQKKRQSKRLGLILWPFIVVIIRYHYYFTIIINFSFALLPLFRMHIFIDWVECGRANSIALNIS